MRDGVCRASVATLAARLNMNPSTIKRHLGTLIDSGYLQDLTPGRRNRPHIYQPAGKYKRKPAPETALPDDDDTEDIPTTGSAESTTSTDTGSAESTTSGAENTTRYGRKHHPGSAERAMSDTIRYKERNSKEDTDSPTSKAKKLWEPILQNLKSQASKPFYEEYLQPITPQSWDGTNLTLTVPDPALAEIIRARLGTQITRYLRATSENQDASIIFKS
jgi:hypothetical protein